MTKRPLVDIDAFSVVGMVITLLPYVRRTLTKLP